MIFESCLSHFADVNDLAKLIIGQFQVPRLEFYFILFSLINHVH